MAERLADAVKRVVAINLRYTSLLLNLTKEYVKAFEGAVRDGMSTRSDAAGSTPPAAQAAPEGAPASRRTPILLAGEIGEEVTGAFALANSSDKELTVNLLVQGQLDPGDVQLNPSALTLAPGTNATIRLKVKLTSALDEGRDYLGAVFAPGLSTQAIEFVLRRLPASSPATKPASKKKPASG